MNRITMNARTLALLMLLLGLSLGALLGRAPNHPAFILHRPILEDQACIHPDVAASWHLNHTNGCIQLEDLLAMLD